MVTDPFDDYISSDELASLLDDNYDDGDQFVDEEYYSEWLELSRVIEPDLTFDNYGWTKGLDY